MKRTLEQIPEQMQEYQLYTLDRYFTNITIEIKGKNYIIRDELTEKEYIYKPIEGAPPYYKKEENQ